MSLAAVAEGARRQAVRTAARVLPYVPDSWVFAALRKWVDAIPYEQGRVFTRRLISAAKELLKRVSPNCRKRIVENFAINNYFLGVPRRRAFRAELGADAPYVIAISPTMRCNLRCAGCYAGDYSKAQNMSHELFARVIGEARDLGVYFITLSGGECFLRDDLLGIFRTFSDCYFQVFTNGTLIGDAMAAALADVGNVMPAVSVEGFEAETDARRGKGTFARVLRAMAALRREGVPFAFSATATRQNNDLLVSDEFVDFWAAQGCFFGWYFNYVPIGLRPDPDLMPTPEQRVHRIRRLAELRRTRQIPLADFWNDGPLVGGCMAGGKYCLHINSLGDVEPCVFAHFAVDNLRDKPLKEALNSAFFREIRARQPFHANHLRACMITDNPAVLRELVAKTGAHPTHENADTLLRSLAPQLDRYAARYGRLADETWKTYRGLDSDGARG